MLRNQSTWTRQDDKVFESALTVVPENAADRWEQIASYVPGKTAEEIRVHYEKLVYDLDDIAAGRVDNEIPNYVDDYNEVEEETELVGNRKNEFRTSQISFGGPPEVREKPRKKGTPWTNDEHRKFLKGLAKFGKGDWRSISRNAVVTRTPTQVASHAQKYFNRIESSPKERKRSSIHDITITTTDTIMVDQPTPAPPTNVYVAQGAQPTPASPPMQTSNFYAWQEVGKGAPPLPAQAPTGHFYSDQGVGKGAQLPASLPTQPSNFYVGQGVGKGALPPQAPTGHFYSEQGVGKGAPPLPSQAPTSHFYSDQGVGNGAPPLPSQAPASHFYVGQGVGMAPHQQQQQQMAYGYQPNFGYPY